MTVSLINEFQVYFEKDFDIENGVLWEEWIDQCGIEGLK